MPLSHKWHEVSAPYTQIKIDLCFIKICQAVNIRHEIRADLAERPILQRLPSIAFLEKKLYLICKIQ